MANLPHIGTIELVSLLNGRIQDVPAKIDTGADSSSIWASQVQEENGKLSFILFDKASPFYTGKVINTKDYKVTSIKNSFGKSEFRYKTPLQVTLGGKKIKANFTLANRQNNRYPILIGRRTLSGKFLVDVSRRHTKGKFRVLVLSNKISRSTSLYVEALHQNRSQLQITYATYDDLCFMFEPANTKVSLRDGGQDLAAFDLVHFKVTAGHWDVAAATAHYLEQRGVKYIDSAVRNFPSTSKLYQYMILTGNDIAIPASLFLTPKVMAKSFNLVAGNLGLPFVLKDIHGKRGEYNYLVKNRADFDAACKQLNQVGIICIAQAFIDNDGDYRILVLGRSIALIIHRLRKSNNSHLNNTSQGAKARLVELSELPIKVQTDSIEAARLLDRQIAGVDMVKDKTSAMWYCLEVNDGPQIATGSFTTEKHQVVADYLENELSK